MSRRDRTLGRALAMAVVTPSIITVALGTSYAALDAVSADVTVAVPPESDLLDEKAPAKGSPAWLIERHDCWTGEPPADMQGVFPGHVVTGNGYEGARVAGLALEQAFDGVDHNLTVYAFCR